MANVDLSKYSNSWYRTSSKLRIVLWMICSAVFFRSSLPFPSFFKVSLLRVFGSRCGMGVVIKPSINIKYPWLLSIGNYVWLGENVWIDNLCEVEIQDSVCISQGALLLTGNHDYKKSTFDLIVGKIILKSGCWVGAMSTVCPGVTLHENSVLSVGSVATSDLEKNYIYQGNPAQKKKRRIID
ncbi:colanic acid biosynthesis acetyltransferase WcaF [Vibrio vulnificus]|nr:colanic acid biosynthesis acetyltransferase WcaF [Vibrio vulnificus]